MKNLAKRRHTWLVTIFLLSGISGGCRDEPSRPCHLPPGDLGITSLSLHVLTGDLTKDLAPTKAEVQSEIRAAAKETRGVSLLQGRKCPQSWAMSLTVEFQQSAGRTKGRATVLVALQLKRNGSKALPWSYQVVGDKLYDLGPEARPKKFLLATFRRTLHDILRYPVARLRLEQAPPKRVIGAILAGSLEPEAVATAHQAREATCVVTSAHLGAAPRVTALAQVLCPTLTSALVYPRSDFERDVTDMAVREAGRRRLRQATPVLLSLLDAPIRAETQSAVLDAIVEIADPSSVDALVRLADHKDSEDLARIVEAVGRIGGPKAEAFLRFLADGNEDETIRNMARSTLKELRRKNR